MIVVDASVVIALLSPGDAHHDQAAGLVIAHDEFRLHPVTLAEVMVGPARRGRQDETFHHLRALGFSVDVPGGREPVQVASLRAETGLKLPDCYVLATAASLRRPLASFDRRLADCARDQRVEVVELGPTAA